MRFSPTLQMDKLRLVMKDLLGLLLRTAVKWDTIAVEPRPAHASLARYGLELNQLVKVSQKYMYFIVIAHGCL